jgi:hypothetical protein
MDGAADFADETTGLGTEVGLSRRSILRRSVAAAAALTTAGCTGDGRRGSPQSEGESSDAPAPDVEYDGASTEPVCPPDPPTSAGTPMSAGTLTDVARSQTGTPEGGGISIASVSATDFIQYALSGTHPVVTRETGTQYVTVRCDTTGSRAEVRERVALRLDGESIPLSGRQPYGWEHETVDLAFAVPKTETYAGGTVVVDGAHQPLSEATIERLNDPPAFVVSRPTVSPDAIEAGEEATAEVRFTLENVCRGRGTFGASISGADSGYGPVTATLDPGEEREITAETRIVGRSNGTRVALEWGTNRFVATIPVIGTASE